MHAFTHQLFLLFGTKVEQASDVLCAFCTDFGVETSVAKTKSIPLSLLCPYAVDLGFEPEAGAAEHEEQDDPKVHYGSGLQVPGALHILHNLTDNVLSSLDHFEDVKPMMKAGYNT